jgi:hypothetical protein
MIILFDEENGVYDKAVVLHEELDQSILDIVQHMELINGEYEGDDEHENESGVDIEVLS